MNTTKSERTNEAVKAMQKLGIYKPYITGFQKHGTPCFYEKFGGFWTYQEKELQKKIDEIEKKHNCTVYAVTHEFTEFGECYDFLIITDYKEEWEDLLTNDGRYFYAFAYVWNKDDDFCSEFGTIAIQSAFGGIRRVG